MKLWLVEYALDGKTLGEAFVCGDTRREARKRFYIHEAPFLPDGVKVRGIKLYASAKELDLDILFERKP